MSAEIRRRGAAADRAAWVRLQARCDLDCRTGRVSAAAVRRCCLLLLLRRCLFSPTLPFVAVSRSRSNERAGEEGRQAGGRAERTSDHATWTALSQHRTPATIQAWILARSLCKHGHQQQAKRVCHVRSHQMHLPRSPLIVMHDASEMMKPKIAILLLCSLSAFTVSVDESASCSLRAC